MSMIFGILIGLVLGWLGHHYWLKGKPPVASGKATTMGGGGPGEE